MLAAYPDVEVVGQAASGPRGCDRRPDPPA